jgi:hypothetical protein
MHAIETEILNQLARADIRPVTVVLLIHASKKIIDFQNEETLFGWTNDLCFMLPAQIKISKECAIAQLPRSRCALSPAGIEPTFKV